MTPEEIKTLQDESAATKAKNDELQKEIEKLKAKPADPPPADPSLKDKAEKERLETEGKKNETKKIESALAFNMNIEAFVKDHQAALPKDVEGILKTASKENYENASHKANALRAALVESFFGVQENLDLLTPPQKVALADFLKLTQNKREETSEEIYTNYFEPALETLKKVRRATELAKSQSGKLETAGEKAYIDRLVKHSRKALIGKEAS